MSAGRFDAAIAAIDAANADDPNRLVVRGRERPKEQAHAELMTEWVSRLDPAADEAQLLAARAHHLRRWSLPRADFPAGRRGYLRWRTELRKRHAAEVGAILGDLGYPEVVVADVQTIVSKKGLGTDPRVQTHEDALCLVFFETQLDRVVDGLDPDKALDVLAKTLAKMSPAALDELDRLDLPADHRAVVERARSA